MDPEAITALADVEHWLWTLEREMTRLEAVHGAGGRVVSAAGGYTDEARRLFSESSAQTLWVVLAAEHLATALESAFTPKPLAEMRIQPELRARIKLLRNIYEHWDESRLGQGGSIKDYEAAYPGRTPFSSSSSADEGLRVGGILSMDELRAVAERVRAAHATIPSPLGPTS